MEPDARSGVEHHESQRLLLSGHRLQHGEDLDAEEHADGERLLASAEAGDGELLFLQDPRHLLPIQEDNRRRSAEPRFGQRQQVFACLSAAGAHQRHARGGFFGDGHGQASERKQDCEHEK